MYSYQCNSTENVFLISKECLKNDFLGNAECVAAYDKAVLAFRYIEGYYLIVVALICGIGNLITILSVLIARRKHRHGFDSKYRQITIFIIHLCLVDLFWSITSAWPLSYELIAMKWPFGKILCSAKVLFAIVLSLVESQSIALVAVSRYLDLTKSNMWIRWTDNNFSLTAILQHLGFFL